MERDEAHRIGAATAIYQRVDRDLRGHVERELRALAEAELQSKDLQRYLDAGLAHRKAAVLSGSLGKAVDDSLTMMGGNDVPVFRSTVAEMRTSLRQKALNASVPDVDPIWQRLEIFVRLLFWADDVAGDYDDPARFPAAEPEAG